MKIVIKEIPNLKDRDPEENCPARYQVTRRGREECAERNRREGFCRSRGNGYFRPIDPNKWGMMDEDER
jgi:hypothetical protein